MSEKPKALGAAGSAVGLSAIALAFGACCVAPWAVALLGVGGAVMLARLAVLQPYVVAVTLVLSGLAFWYAYRKQPAAAVESCPAGSRKGVRMAVWIGALLVVIVDVVSYVAPHLSSLW